MSNTKFKAGDVVKCVDSGGYSLTEGKEYTVIEVQESCRDTNIAFTWPEYVGFIDDRGRKALSHTYRFQKVQQ